MGPLCCVVEAQRLGGRRDRRLLFREMGCPCDHSVTAGRTSAAELRGCPEFTAGVLRMGAVYGSDRT